MTPQDLRVESQSSSGQKEHPRIHWGRDLGITVSY